MTEEEYQAKLKEKAAKLYSVLVNDPYQVPALCPSNKKIYPDKICSPTQEGFWLSLVEQLQIGR